MSWRNIVTIYSKELLDSVRDRRTLVSVIVIPTFVMPALILGAGRVATAAVYRAKQEIPRVMVVGGADSPDVCASLGESGKFRVESASADWKAQISDKRVRAAVEIPAGFERALETGPAPAVTVYFYQGELKSGLAADGLRGFFTGLRDQAAARLLRAHGISPVLARPFEVRQTNVAPSERIVGNTVGGIVAYFIIFLCLTGALYPALDLTAGEKERGTMEMLLCTPVARGDIVIGKFLMVLTGSLSSVLFSLISMAATILVAGSALGAAAGAGETLVDPLGVLGVLAMIVPIAVLFSAVLFSVALCARTFKEAQSYVAPMAIVVALLCVGGMIPGIDLSAKLALVPILNISLVCREMLSGVWHWGFISAILASTALYAALALALAVWLFRRESVVFRT
jgi:sodium transport system permease protein